MFCFKLLSLTLIAVQFANGDIVVQSENGPIRGKTVASGKVEAFLGIPYAEPPIGHLRFAKPVPKTSWNDELDATQLPPSCVQAKLDNVYYAPDLSNMNEDCLYLNVWMPQAKSGDDLKSIMLFIHGGGFMFGSSNMASYDGTNLAEYGDVIVVSINYRLGALGFFAGFTEDAPGSQGLYDQVMAMQWTKDNAKHFHGDPENIVIFGESAGSFAVSMHQISPLSKNLFKRAILEGGSAINPLYTDANKVVFETSQIYANLLGCTSDEMTLEKDPRAVTDCLRNVPADKIAEAESIAFANEPIKKLVPRIGNTFLPENSIEMFRKGHFKDSEVLMGISTDEGSLFLGMLDTNLFTKDTEPFYNETIANNTLMSFMKYIDDPAERHKIIRSYLDNVNEETGYTYFKAVSEAVGDIIVTCGMIFQAEYQSMRDNPVYFYVFDHRTSSNYVPEWMGIPHCEDTQYIFGNPLHKDFTEHELELSRDIMDMWVTFAKTGNPTIPGGATWPKYTFEDPKYLKIGRRDCGSTRPNKYRCERWRNLYRSAIDDFVIEALKKH